MDRKLDIQVADILQKHGTLKDVSICINIDTYEEIKFLRPIIGQVKFVSTNNDIIGYFDIEGEVEEICSRCGIAFPLKITSNFHQVFTFDDSEQNLQINKQVCFQIGFQPLKNKNETINIFPVVMQEIILAIPIKPLCKKCKE